MAGSVPKGASYAQSRSSGKTSKQTRHSAKQRRQGEFVKLNLSICSAADAGVEVLLELVYDRRADMNLVNFSTALHRLARLAEEGGIARKPSLRDPRYFCLLEGARAALMSTEDSGKARCLSTIGWAIARLGLEHPQMMQEISAMALPRVSEFKPYELGILLWSYAKLQIPQNQLFEAAYEHIADRIEDFGAASLATLVWSYTTARIPCCTKLAREAADSFAMRLRPESPSSVPEKVQPVALENMMWGLATLRTQPQRQSLLVIAEEALKVLEDFKVYEFTIILWAFARLGFFPTNLFAAASKLVMRSEVLRNKMHAQGIANLLWAFAKHAEKDGSTEFVAVVRSLLPTCQKLLPQLKPQELGCVLSSLSELGTSWGADTTLDDIFVTAAWVGNPASDEWSLSSVVKTLKAYHRFFGSQGVVVEPCSTFVMQLICLCACSEDKLDGQSITAIVEVIPPTLNLYPEAAQALAKIALVGIRSNDLPRRCMTRLVDLANSVCEVSSETCHPAGTCTHSYEEQLPMPPPDNFQSDELWMEFAGLEDAFFDSMQPMPEIHAFGAATDWNNMSQLATNMGPAYGSFTCQSWLRPELQNFDKDVDTHGIASLVSQDVAYINVPASKEPPARLAVLEDFTPADVVGNRTTIMFEVDSDAMLVTCDVEIQCYCNRMLYDIQKLSIEAGSSIPNTHVLNLTQLEPGQYDIYFYLNMPAWEAQSEKFSFRVTGELPISPDSVKQSVVTKASPMVDVTQLTNLLLKANVFNSNSSGGSTCVGGLSSMSEASYGQAITSDEE